MAILVLGGAGYIGSHTVRRLVESGEEAVVVDNLTTGHAAAVHPGARLVRGDVRDEAFLDGLLTRERIDAAVHFAASSLVGESMDDPLKYYDNNLYGALVLVRALTRHGVGRLVFSSTAATYGEPENIPILESDRAIPENPYGETKLAMERMFGWAARAGGPRFASLRYFNAAGAAAGGGIGEAHQPETHLLPLILQAALGQRAEVRLFGDDYPTPDGTCVRDYIHVDDLALAHTLALDYLARGGKSDVFNLGNGVGFSVMEVLGMCRRVTGRAIPAATAPRRPGDPARLVASNEKARRILGFSPARSGLEEIVASAWNWHRTHPNGYSA